MGCLKKVKQNLQTSRFKQGRARNTLAIHHDIESLDTAAQIQLHMIRRDKILTLIRCLQNPSSEKTRKPEPGEA
jgi:hypothetical protein